jgi:hypothetical protein
MDSSKKLLGRDNLTLFCCVELFWLGFCGLNFAKRLSLELERLWKECDIWRGGLGGRVRGGSFMTVLFWCDLGLFGDFGFFGDFLSCWDLSCELSCDFELFCDFL